jgi:hypothetical protein
MLISELLKENELNKHKSKLPKAASLDDGPEDIEGVEGEDDGETNDSAAGVDAFSKVAAQFGPDLYSFSSIEYFDGWDARNATGLVNKLRGIDLDGLDGAIGSMGAASGRDGALTFIIVNGRSGEVVVAGFGMDAISDGIQMDTLESDQVPVIEKINRVNEKFSANGGGGDEENKYSGGFREQLLALLSYGDQPEKSDKPAIKMGGMKLSPEDEQWALDRRKEKADKRRQERNARLAAKGIHLE